MVVRAPVALVALALTASPVAGQAYAPAAQFTEQLPPEARQAAATIDAFHEALRRGDTNAALAMLADDAVIYESGHAERKTEYAAHHLAADAAYAQAVPSTISRRTGGMTDALAWIATEGRTTGSRGRARPS